MLGTNEPRRLVSFKEALSIELGLRSARWIESSNKIHIAKRLREAEGKRLVHLLGDVRKRLGSFASAECGHSAYEDAFNASVWVRLLGKIDGMTAQRT